MLLFNENSTFITINVLSLDTSSLRSSRKIPSLTVGDPRPRDRRLRLKIKVCGPVTEYR